MKKFDEAITNFPKCVECYVLYAQVSIYIFSQQVQLCCIIAMQHTLKDSYISTEVMITLCKYVSFFYITISFSIPVVIMPQQFQCPCKDRRKRKIRCPITLMEMSQLSVMIRTIKLQVVFSQQVAGAAVLLRIHAACTVGFILQC